MQPHEVLGVRPGAGRAEVVAAFRQFALRNHPDRGGNRSRFQDGVEAYRLLTAPRPGTPTLTAPRAPADLVFHRRSRPSLGALARRALVRRPPGRRTSTSRRST